MDVIAVLARRWHGGWELEISPEQITQTSTLEAAPQQVRDYLTTLHPDRDYSQVTVMIHQVSSEKQS